MQKIVLIFKSPECHSGTYNHGDHAELGDTTHFNIRWLWLHLCEDVIVCSIIPVVVTFEVWKHLSVHECGFVPVM